MPVVLLKISCKIAFKRFLGALAIESIVSAFFYSTRPRSAFPPILERRIMDVVMSTGIFKGINYANGTRSHIKGLWVPFCMRSGVVCTSPVGIMAHYAIVLKFAVCGWGQLWG